SIRRSPSLRTRRPRSRADIAAHGPLSALRAASTAAWRSSTPADATTPHTPSVAGFTTSIVWPEAAGRHSLLMRSCFCSTAVVVVMRFLSQILFRRFCQLFYCAWGPTPTRLRHLSNSGDLSLVWVLLVAAFTLRPTGRGV